MERGLGGSRGETERATIRRSIADENNKAKGGDEKNKRTGPNDAYTLKKFSQERGEWSTRGR